MVRAIGTGGAWRGVGPVKGDSEGRRILMLDSGVGGLSVLAEIRRRLPGLGVVYVADSAFYPYGNKPEAALVRRLPALLAGLCARYRPAAVVVACNTASTVALPATRAAVTASVVGCVPAIKPAAEISRSRCIGLLGTPGTVRYYGCPAEERITGKTFMARAGAFDDLDAPIRRLNGAFTPSPYSPTLEAAIVPNSNTIALAIRDLLEE